MTVGERAAELQIDVLLHELAGVVPAPDLAARIANRCAEGGGRRAALPGWAWAAALLVVGLGAVVAVAWSRRDAAAMAPVQEPRPGDADGGDPRSQEPKPTEPSAQDPKNQDPQTGPNAPGRTLTLIAGYADNRVTAVDATGALVFALEEVFGAWDAELLPNGNVLVTEFSASRVRELDRTGKTVWTYENLKNPYAAQRIAGGNLDGMTLIADTFADRVVLVRPDGTEFWSYGDHEHEDIRPFDCEFTPSGTFLIADVKHDRVLEIDLHGFVLWQQDGLPFVHDADRLPNGNTLVTLRNRGEVRELDDRGKVVWQLSELDDPSDADRLANGHTFVAETGRVREFDRDGKVVWQRTATWAVEANRYPR